MAVQIGDLHLFSLRDGVPGLLRSKDAAIVFLLTLASLFTRLYQIGRRPNVTWDEAHFGKFGAYYINHTFYHDVHPPLAKMMVALAEVIAGHNGTFRFSSGKKYPEYVDYTLMRAQIAMYGVALVPLAFLTCIQFRLSRPMATLAAVFVLFDNALCVMSRFILLDEPLLFFTALTLWSASNFQNRNKHGPPYTRAWWSWLGMTGFSLGCVMSSKWVGLFCVIMVGIATAEDLVRKYCDMMPWREYGRHWVARALCLILIPLLVYTLTFWIHFKVLYKAGSGDFKMPANFQANLKGNMLNSQPYDIAYGALVDIRAVYNGPGLLHSHVHQYPKGSRQQQVTCFPHRDSNNVWQLRRPAGSPANYTIDPIDFVQDGDIIQLTHNLTGATIRASKGILAPLTVSHYEVAAENITHATDVGLTNWKIEVVKQKASRAGKRIHAMTTVFRLRHEDTGCIMRVGGRKLPEWGWHQSEVTCLPDSTRKKNVRSNDVLWYIEHNTNTRLAKDDLSKYVSSNFIVDMVTLNIEMGKTNNALSPDRDKYNSLESDPWSWPLLTFPMRMVGWGNKTIKYYEIGNPILWWASALVCFLYPFRLLYFVLRWQRQCNDWPRNGFREFWDNSKFLWGGWALHYIPFFLMGRVTYIHHYLPALYFALLQLAFDIDFALKRWRRGRYLTVAAWGIGAAVFVVFLYFAPFTFGWNKPMKELAGRRWLKTWNIYEDMYDM
ncbi:PMT-domain-containing protein [Linderina pennispora]|uniref:Dolichyl-phosphate-mannose--protein mannosyltransferase n=1 Tax=Linderina pennispora TaxID=61395 RepID=A0A1Y1WJN0_9FUNG|nr:PMT-domain-containing protein [Linderina pennispora]ORX73693.1 PMT-domain-containing protein [Linderina pennispora]